MSECHAAIQRGDFSASMAARAGAVAGCPFCLSRGSGIPEAGDQILFLNGHRAGALAKVSETPNTIDPHGFLVSSSSGHTSTEQRVSADRDLFAVLPLPPIPDWCPPFNVKRSFIIDELAVWFCNRGLIGGAFHWKRSDITIATQVCWQSKLAISASELSAVMMAHGMPPDRQSEFEGYFDFGIATLVCAAGRTAVRKWRQPLALRDEFSDAMRLWGR